MKRVILIITVAFLLFSAGNLYAQLGAGENYAGARLGIFNPNNDSDGLKDFDRGVNIEAFYGYKINPNFAIEAGIGYYNTDFEESWTEDYYVERREVPLKSKMEVTARAIPVTVTALGLMPLNEQFELYGGAGVGVYFAKIKVDHKVSLNGESYSDSYSESDTAFGFHLVGGADFNISDNIALGAQAKWFKVKPDFNGGKVNFGGTMFNAGVKFKF